MRKYNAPGHIERMLVASGYDWTRIVNAVQSELNKATPIDGKDTHSAGLLKYAAARKMSDGTLRPATVSWRETTGKSFSVKATEPAVFAAWTDAVLDLFAKQGEPSGELPEAFLPAARLVWLAVFKAADKPDDATTEEESADKSARRNGGVKDHKTPAPATAK